MQSDDWRTKHGHNVRNKRTKEYRAWDNMKSRCLNPTFTQYDDYGGRGITIDPAWINDFRVFLAQVGPAPSPHHTLDRIDNNRGYELGNVRWATWSEQNNNQRDRRPLYDGLCLRGHIRHVRPNGTLRCLVCTNASQRQRHYLMTLDALLAA